MEWQKYDSNREEWIVGFGNKENFKVSVSDLVVDFSPKEYFMTPIMDLKSESTDGRRFGQGGVNIVLCSRNIGKCSVVQKKKAEKCLQYKTVFTFPYLDRLPSAFSAFGFVISVMEYPFGEKINQIGGGGHFKNFSHKAE